MRRSKFKNKACESIIPELRTLRGGAKSMWLRIHRQEVIEYASLNGIFAARLKYGITNDRVIEDLYLRRGNPRSSSETKPVPYNKEYDPLFAKPVERPEFEYLHQDVISLRKEVRELKRIFSLFQESVADSLAKKLMIPMLEQTIELPEGMDLKLDNPLKIRY